MAAAEARARRRRPGARRVLRHRRPHASASRRPVRGCERHRARLHRRRCWCVARREGRSARPRGLAVRACPSSHGDLLDLPFADGRVRRRHRRVGRAQRPRRAARLRGDGARHAAGRARRVSRVHAGAGRARSERFHDVWMGRVVPRARPGSSPATRAAYAYLPASVRGVPARRRARGHHGRRRPRRACATGASASAPWRCTSARCPRRPPGPRRGVSSAAHRRRAARRRAPLVPPSLLGLDGAEARVRARPATASRSA